MHAILEKLNSGSRSVPLRRLAYCVIFFLAAGVNTALASPIYELSGTLEWNPASGADRLGLNGTDFVMIFEVTDLTPTNVADPNGTQSQYEGFGTLSVGGTPIDIASSFASFFHSDSGMDDVANFIFSPTSGDPMVYLPAANLIPGANTGAAVQPPIYPTSVVSSATGFLVVPGVDPDAVDNNAVYSMSSLTFNSIAVSEPSALTLLGLGLAGVGIWRRRMKTPKN